MRKIYYNINGWVCGRSPYNLPQSNTFIQVSEEDYIKTLSCKDHFSWRVKNGELVMEQYEEIPILETYKTEYAELKLWFENIYAYQEQKYRRLIALSKTDDDGTSASEKLNNLYEEAETKRKRIQAIEKFL